MRSGAGFGPSFSIEVEVPDADGEVRVTETAVSPDRSDPFVIHVPDAVLEDLHRRLAETRWPPALHGGGWTLGRSSVNAAMADAVS